MRRKLAKRIEDSGADSEYTVISQVAHMYYNLNMLQPEIADKLYFSRSKVSRLLKRAKELGIVEIKVHSIPGRTPPIERRLMEAFPLKDAIVVENFMEGSGEGILDAVVDFAAIYVSELLRDNTIVGITRGRTVDKVVGKLRKLHECRLQVVQLMGSSTNTYLSAESRELVRSMISTFSATAHFLNTPLYVDDIYAKTVLLSDPAIQDVFQQMKRCDVILTGIGNLELQPGAQPGWYGYQNQRHIAELSQKGAVGSVCAQYFDRNGNYIPCEWNEKCIAMPYADILRNDMTVVVAQGPQKIEPVLGALRGRLINVLITDASTATGILKKYRK